MLNTITVEVHVERHVSSAFTACHLHQGAIITDNGLTREPDVSLHRVLIVRICVAQPLRRFITTKGSYR